MAFSVEVLIFYVLWINRVNDLKHCDLFDDELSLFGNAGIGSVGKYS